MAEHPSSRHAPPDLKDSIWTFYQNGGGHEDENKVALLSDFLAAGKLELAMELLKFFELERISNDIESIKETIEGMDQDLANIAAAVSNLQP
jgi:hypothetical protein